MWRSERRSAQLASAIFIEPIYFPWNCIASSSTLSLSNRTGWEIKVMMRSGSKRGRPKGTGIDDSDRIARLVELLRVHPDLRPTTAIRVMGFSDPSAIRRLRDKYKCFINSAKIRAAADGAKNGTAPRIPRPANDVAAVRSVP